MIVLLDSSPLGMLTNPNNTNKTKAITKWAISLRRAKVSIIVPEICDYELRRSLIRRNNQKAISKLDYLNRNFGYLVLDTKTLQLAARFWADLRNKGLATTGDKELDCDVILAAQAVIVSQKPENIGERVIIASENLKHITRLADADTWKNIKP